MSWKISGLVWDLELTHSEQSVLLALADHANHSGGRVFPSVGLVAWKTGYSIRQVRRVMSSLRGQNILVLVREASRYTPREYRININAGKKKKPYRDDSASPLGVDTEKAPIYRGATGGTPAARDDTAMSARDDTAMSARDDTAMSARDDTAMSAEQSLNTNEPPVKDIDDESFTLMEFIKFFHDLTKIPEPSPKTKFGKKERDEWWEAAIEALSIAGGDLERAKFLAKHAFVHCVEQELTLVGPKSLLKTMRSVAGGIVKGGLRAEGQEFLSELRGGE